MSDTAVVVLPSPALRRRHAGDADELAVRRVAQAVEHPERDLRLVAAVGLELVGQQAGRARRSTSIG